jgi:Ras-related protein Rab-1A
MLNNKYDRLFNILIIGDINVGKSTLMLFFANNSFKNESYMHQIGIDYKIKILKINGLKIKFQLWDFGNYEKCNVSLLNRNKKINGIIIIFDVTSKKSFDDSKIWLSKIINNIEYDINNTKILLLGNKIDLIDERYVTSEEAQELATYYNIEYIELCLKNMVSVNIIFTTILKAKPISTKVLTQKENTKFSDLFVKWINNLFK